MKQSRAFVLSQVALPPAEPGGEAILRWLIVDRSGASRLNPPGTPAPIRHDETDDASALAEMEASAERRQSTAERLDSTKHALFVAVLRGQLGEYGVTLVTKR